ncbi:virion structural protein [Mycobacterium phage Phabba]|uniref:Uncharacterized protein n=1 Tax=Mycobacterium phage Phabba TaxID=2027899 RepID=A0A249XSV8_9CAUD|nr:virion structural protein [Mycobacterium phage Phabba]ASZ74786.1 hypothetical protein SEA_PHABBA_249 [Mycobacterium phage Phabba]
MQKRALTINFQRSVGSKPVVMEVAINPLAEPSAPDLDATLVGRESRDVLLKDENNPVVFELVPTDHPDLTVRVPYRIAWREKYMGRVFTKDFVMPDFDVDFDDLEDLGNIIGGEVYLQWSDRSRPGGVAGLDSQGRVVDADGNPVSGAESAAVVQGKLDAEIVKRQQEDTFLRTYFLQYAQDQLTQVYQTISSQLSAATQQLSNADLTEKTKREQAVVQLNTAISNLQSAVNTQIAGLNGLIDDVETQLGVKADLVGGKIPSSQLPDVALGKAVTVANEAAMLALTSSQIQPGDFAVRPDGIFFLNASPASQIGNWVRFQVSATVLSVNGQTGAVVLSAADVGARSASQPVPFAEVSGLAAAFTAKTDVSVTNAINARLAALEGDTTIVRTQGGVVPRTLMGTFLAYINGDGQVTRKDGTVLNLGGGGGDLDIGDVTGLTEALAGKVSTTDPALTNPRTPTAHAASHATGGTDAITPASIGARAVGVNVPIADVAGLQAILTNNALTATSDLDGRISSVEQQLEDLEPGGGGGTGSSAKTVWFNAGGLTTDLSSVLLRSPFGINAQSQYYYNPAGADPGEAVWPYLTPNGHLKFVKRNESAPADEPLATQAALSALQAIVAAKADSADLATANAAINTKASLAALSTLQALVDTKATTTQVNNLADSLATKATQTQVDGIATAVAGKANQTDLQALTTEVGTKATTTSVTTLSGIVSGLQTGKADLTGGKVPVSQLPVQPISNIDGLQAALDARATLVGGKVPLAQLPDVGINKVEGLTAALGAKADLVDGKVPSTQIPSVALNAVFAVANRPAMLALTTSQVQRGDMAIITATADKGSYILNADDPSVFGNWIKLSTPDDAVQSINGQTGVVVLGPSDVGARASGVQLTIAETNGLQTALDSKASTTQLTTGLAGKTAPADVFNQISEAVANKQKADYASTSAVASLSGQQSIDGTLVPIGAVVLLTAQSSSVNNGLYVVNSGAWTRVSDMATGQYFLKGTMAVVVSGASHGQTLWLQTNNSGIVGTNANNWTKVLTAGVVPSFTATNGVKRLGNDFQLDAATGGGIIIVNGKAALDPVVATRKYAGDVPAGSTVATITHNLNNLDVTASFRDKSGGDAVLLGWKPTGVNTISAEFAVPPTAGQWRVVVMG